MGHPNKEIMGQGFTCKGCGINYNYSFNFCPDCGRCHFLHNHTQPIPLGIENKK